MKRIFSTKFTPTSKRRQQLGGQRSSLTRHLKNTMARAKTHPGLESYYRDRAIAMARRLRLVIEELNQLKQE